ncbi:hypothetical protein JCM19233_4904 [Vibrio astriarenae]|nr:hypothetical protein JCM19233_4904 [Vibrio sp. C7]
MQLLVLYGVLAYVLRQIPALSAALAGSFPTSQSFTARDAIAPTLAAVTTMKAAKDLWGKMPSRGGSENTLQKGGGVSASNQTQSHREQERHNDMLQRMREAEYLNSQQ